MTDLVIWVALVLLVAGVLASFVPMVPGGLLSLAGIVVHWWVTGEPSGVALVGLVVLAVGTVVLDWLGSAVAARLGGASLRTAALAAVVGILGLVVLGPLGLLVGVAATVFLLELRRHGDLERGVRTAAIATVGVLASTALQLVLTGALLVGFVLVVVV